MKFLHTRIRVGVLQRSIDFYCKHFGFQIKSRSEHSPSGNHVAHLELPGNAHQLELTWSADYEVKVPEDLMHLAIGVDDLIAFCHQLEKGGIGIWPNNWQKEFVSGKKMAFIDDPDGYEIELLEGEPSSFLEETS